MKIYLKLFLFVLIAFTSLNFAQINTERFRQDSDSAGVSGKVDIDALAQTGNTDFQFIGLGGRLNYNRVTGYSFFVFSGGYGWNNGKQFSNELVAHLRNVERLNDWIQFEVFLQFDYNKKRKLLSREIAGAGLRYKIFTSETFKFRLGSAYFYEIENYDLDENSLHDKNVNAHRLSTYSTFEYQIKDGVGFLSVTYFQPDIQNFSDYRLISENTLTFDISELISFNVKFNLRYDATPPDEIKDTDTATRLGISFKF